MANYFCIDADGQKQGPFGREQLQELAEQGIITPDTPTETEMGGNIYKRPARQIVDLFRVIPQEQGKPVKDVPTKSDTGISKLLAGKSALQKTWKKNPASVIIAIAAIVVFFCVFIPVPLPCGKCTKDPSLYRTFRPQEYCEICKRTGIRLRTVFNYMNN